LSLPLYLVLPLDNDQVTCQVVTSYAAYQIHIHTSTMSTSWDNARRHARALETALDAKLSTYSKIASTITRAGSSSSKPEDSEDGEGGYKLVEEEIEELISKVCQCFL
jgi:hypothetical protein